MISLAQSGRDHHAFNRAAIHKDELLRPRLPAHPRLPDQAVDIDLAQTGASQGKQPFEQFVSVQIPDAVLQICRRRKLKHEPIVADKGESNLGMSYRLEVELVFDVPAFGIFRAKKFPAGGQIIKKRTRFDLRSRCIPAVAHNIDFAAVYDDLGAGNSARLARRQSKARNTRDARQSFSAKSKRGDRLEIGRRTNLARGITLERKKRVIAIHAATVIDHPNERNSTAANQDVDLARAGVDAVLDEFFDHRSGPFHYFAGRDLAGDDLRQQSNAAHFNSDFRFQIADCTLRINNRQDELVIHL